MATKAAKKTKAVKEPKPRKSSLRDKIAFLERQCEQLGKERNKFAIENENLTHEYNELLNENVRLHNQNVDLHNQLESRKSIRAWVLRRLGLR